MITTKLIRTQWNPEEKLITTEISGDADMHDIMEWEQTLKDSLEKIPDNTTFKIFVNLYGFKAINLEAHKKFREIIPLTLAQYGWKVGYLDLFSEEAKTIVYAFTRGIRCVAAVHVHHDDTKMELYQSRFSKPNEQFLTNPEKAESWIKLISV